MHRHFIRRLPGRLLALASIAILALSAGPVRASDHQDSPTTVSHPGADITDVFVFPSPHDKSKVVLAMDVSPLIPANMGHSRFFDPGVMYQFKIGTDAHYTEDLVLQFKAIGTDGSQQIGMYGPAKPAMTGTESKFVQKTATFGYDKVTSFPNGVTVYAGPREDPFFFDLTQFFALLPDRNFQNQPNVPGGIAGCFRKPGVDTLANFNVLSFVVEMPRSMLLDAHGHLGRINVWTTTSLPDSDAAVQPASPLAALASVTQHLNEVLFDAGDDTQTYTQIERLGRPAIKEAFENYANHDETNRHTITDDKLLAQSIHTFAKTVAHRSNEIADALDKTLMPDAIEADLSAPGPARYLSIETNGKSGLPVAVVRLVPVHSIYGIKRALGDPYRMFGGRDLGSPVIDLSLGAIFGSLLPKLGLAHDDHRETPCLTSDHVTPAAKHYLSSFPYIGEPR